MIFLAKNNHKRYNLSIMDPNQNLGKNPAATIANAAMNGATPVVTTTDLNASDVAPEPTLQTPVLDTSALGAPILDTAALEANAITETTPAPAPEDNGPVSLAPSADFQMGEAPVTEVGIPADTTSKGPGAEDYNKTDDAMGEKVSAKDLKQEYKDDPLIAAAPVPGSIGSAKSYADIQRAEAEKAAKMAAKSANGAKDKKNIIIIGAVAAVAVISVVVGGILMFGGNSKPTSAPVITSYPDTSEAEYSTLSCKRNLVPEEYVSYSALSGTQENIFYFKDDVLDGLATNFAYTYQDQLTTNFWRDKLAADYGVTPNADEDENEEDENDESEEPEMDEDTEAETTGKKTTAEMLHHYVTTKDFVVTHGMEIKSEDINDWLASDAYSDVTYGASENGAAAPVEEGEEEEEEETETEDGEVIRNLKYYNRLQNSIDYKCSISKGY